MEKHPIVQSIQSQMAAWLDEMEKKGQRVSEEEFTQHATQIMEGYLNVPDPDFNGFTTLQMSAMINAPFQEGCPVQLRNLTIEQIAQIPIMRQTLHLMKALEEQELKLTNIGYLPVRMVEELYQMGSHSWETDWFKQKTEAKCREVQTLRGVLMQTGLIKTRSGKMSLTEKGKKLLNDPNALMRVIITFLFTDYNTGWLDGVDDPEIGNLGRVYSLWLLHHYGHQLMLVDFYREYYFKAFPDLIDESIYNSRVFQRLFRLIGLCEINDSQEYRRLGWILQTRKTPILEMMFSFEEPAMTQEEYENKEDI